MKWTRTILQLLEQWSRHSALGMECNLQQHTNYQHQTESYPTCDEVAQYSDVGDLSLWLKHTQRHTHTHTDSRSVTEKFWYKFFNKWQIQIRNQRFQTRVVNSPGNKFPMREINFRGLVRDSIDRITSCDCQCNCSVAAGHPSEWRVPPTCTYARARGWYTPLVTAAGVPGNTVITCHFLTSAAWRTDHWSRTDGLTIARISCCCGSHIIHADSEFITVNSDYTCCAKRLMLNLKGVGTKDG